MKFKNGMKIKCRTGRYVEHLDHPLWGEWKNRRLFVQYDKSGNPALVTLADENWAEYLVKDFDEGSLLFESEGYYLQIQQLVENEKVKD
jgi:hypothetical protein